jgi:hypothetical protein
MTGQDAKQSDEPLAALAPEGGDTDWPSIDKTGKPDKSEGDAAEEIRDPATGAKDDYVLMLGDSTVPVQHRHAELVVPGAHQAPGSGAFPLWPDTPDSHRSLAAPGAHPDLRPGPPVIRRVKPPRRPLLGLPLLVVLALVALLFGWLGAEPFWLAVHHGDAGTLTVTSCTGSGVGKHCLGRFVTADGHYTVGSVTMSGAQDAGRPGAHLTARMVGRDGRLAYVGDNTGLLLRWVLPLAAVVGCGLLIGLATGAWRLHGRARFGAVTLSLLGPLTITACVLALTW